MQNERPEGSLLFPTVFTESPTILRIFNWVNYLLIWKRHRLLLQEILVLTYSHSNLSTSIDAILYFDR